MHACTLCMHAYYACMHTLHMHARMRTESKQNSNKIKPSPQKPRLRRGWGALRAPHLWSGLDFVRASLVLWCLRACVCTVCMHACIVCMHASYACMHNMHACIVCMHYMHACILCMHACMYAYYACMHMTHACMHTVHACILCMHA